MIRIERIKDYLYSQSDPEDSFKIDHKRFSIETDNHELIQVKVVADQIELDRNYEATLRIWDCHKWRDFTKVTLILKDFFQQFGHGQESYNIATDDQIDDHTVLMSVDFKIYEEVHLVPFDEQTDSTGFHEMIRYQGQDYRIEERPPRLGI